MTDQRVTHRLPEEVLIGGVILVAVNLRPAAASIGRVLNRIQTGLLDAGGHPAARADRAPAGTGLTAGRDRTLRR